jgi:hypothetical protein
MLNEDEALARRVALQAALDLARSNDVRNYKADSIVQDAEKFYAFLNPQ